MKFVGHTIYVPTLGMPIRRTIAGGSGIVGTPQPESRQIVIDYEGNLYGQFPTYEERVYHAWSRHTWGEHGYPTVARMVADKDELVEVGWLEFRQVPTVEELRPIFLKRYGAAPPDAMEATRRDMAKPIIRIDRQDVLDEWLAEKPIAVLR